ncbi:MAG: hypothetical protein ACREKI_01525, partial [Gemmatimonadota bacterium]
MRRPLPSWRDWKGWGARMPQIHALWVRVRDRARPHAAPVFCWVSAALLIHAFFPASPIAEFAALEEGMVSRDDVIAEIPFQIRKSDADLQRERADAAASVPPIFVLRPEFADSAAARTGAFFALVDSLVAAAPNAATAQRAIIAGGRRFGLDINEDQAQVLRPSRSRTALRGAVDRSVRELLPRGYAASSDLTEVTASRVLVRDPKGERLLPRDSVPARSRFFEAASARAPSG